MRRWGALALVLGLGCEDPPKPPPDLRAKPIRPVLESTALAEPERAEAPAKSAAPAAPAKPAEAAPTTVEAQRQVIEALLAKWTPVGFCGTGNRWLSFAGRSHNDLEHQALKALVDQPGSAERRGYVLSALTADHQPEMWDYWAGFEKRPDFTDADVSEVIRGLQATDPAKARAYVGERLGKLAWARVVVRAQEYLRDEDRALWPELPLARLEALARSPELGDDREKAWCALLKQAPAAQGTRWRDELLAGTEPRLRAAAVQCGPLLPRATLEKMALEDSDVGYFASQRFFEGGTAGHPLGLRDQLRLAGSANDQMREGADAELRSKYGYSFDTGQMAGIRLEASPKEVDALLAEVKHSPALLRSVTVGSLVGRHLELRGQAEAAAAAYRAARTAGAAFLAASRSHSLARGEDDDLGLALLHLARLEFSQGHATEGGEAANAIAQAHPYSGLDSVFPNDVYSGTGEDVTKQLLTRYSGWLELVVEVASDRRSLQVRLKNRGPQPHTLHLPRPDWKTNVERAPSYVTVWVGARRADSFSSKYSSFNQDKVLAPGETFEFSLPADLSREKRPLRLAVALDLEVDDQKDLWRVEALQFVR